MGLSVFKQEINGQERYGYKNENGEVVINPRYNCAFEFNDGLALTVTFGSNKFRYINEKGENKILLGGGHTDARSFKNGLALAKFNNKWALINTNGDNLTGYVFDNEKSAVINDLPIMAYLIRKNGVKALNWAGQSLLADEDSFKMLKQALKYHLKDLVEKIDEKKVKSEQQFRSLIQNELDKFYEIRQQKLNGFEKTK